ncbi:hypothetical protein [Marinimicrobium sp. LS-A18]|uniref:hypothetical protein n=1 Tax=Marinimicrobium sp. LS-A18 TaxID=1381596 RepID=UPI000465C1C7|nr:hypothetical protein [Marinimicrobium sp. LS-A18]
MKPEEEHPKEQNPVRRSWVAPVLTTLAGILVSILVAWYQINRSEEQAVQAQIERSKAVKSELVRVVEEHIINEKPLDISSLARLAEFRARREDLLVVPTVSEIVQSAEFNILTSQYLEFERKEKFKSYFSQIYAELAIPASLNYDGPFENTVNDIYASIQKGNVSEVASKVNVLVTSFDARLKELEAQQKIKNRKNFEDLVKELIDDPTLIVVTLIAYVSLLYVFWMFRRRIRRRRFIDPETYEEYLRERAEVLHRNSDYGGPDKTFS